MMKIVNRLAKGLKIGLFLLILLLFLNPRPAFGRGGCFANGTNILTPNGNKFIEQLHPGDRVIGFNQVTHQTEEEEIGDIEVVRSPDYYLINGNIKVTGSHPFYVSKNTGLELVEVQNLKLGDRLLDVNSKFTNCYSVRYSEDDEIWVATPSSEEVDENVYQNLISKSELSEQTRLLFVRYQNDWTNKNFAGMTEYIAKPFYKEQYDISVKSFGKNFDIVYKPELYEVVPISYRAKEGKSVFRVQINGQMVNFKISRQGFILSGKAYPRSFTEYWDIEVDTAKQLYLLDISQTSK